MATRVLTSDMVPGTRLSRFRTSFSGRLSEIPLSERPESGKVSVAAGLSGARGAIMALGIEMAAVLMALCVYGVSRL